MFGLLFFLFLSKNVYCINYEKELKNNLMSNYDPNSIPNINNSVVNLKLTMALRSINKIDQLDGTISMNIWLRHAWNDPYLKWDINNWNNISTITLYTDTENDRIWTPDIYLYNTAENPNENLKFSRAIVYNNGDIIWSRPGIITSTCRFDLTDFPYDQQVCSLKYGSWAYDGNRLSLETDVIDISNFQDHGGWTLIDQKSEENINFYECCPEPYYDITFTITLRRIPDYYSLNIIIPTFATASLLIISLIVPWDSGERISFVTTVMLSIIVFLLILSENIPKSDKQPLLSRMIVGLIFYSLVVIFVTILISAMRYYKYGENKYLDKLLGFCKSNDCKRRQDDDDIDLENSNEDNINQSNTNINMSINSECDSKNKNKELKYNLSDSDILRTNSYRVATQYLQNYKKNENNENNENNANNKNNANNLENELNTNKNIRKRISIKNRKEISDILLIDSLINKKEEEHEYEKECKNQAQKVELFFTIIFILGFIIFCIVMNLMKPTY
jgi:hypothetical protein